MNQLQNKNLFSSFYNAFKGIFTAFRESRNLKIHFAAAFLVTVLAVYAGLNYAEWAVIVFLMAVVIFAELINSALENIQDLLRDKAGVPYEFTGKAKDIGAGAVLVIAIASVIVGYLIFRPKLF